MVTVDMFVFAGIGEDDLSHIKNIVIDEVAVVKLFIHVVRLPFGLTNARMFALAGGFIGLDHGPRWSGCIEEKKK